MNPMNPMNPMDRLVDQLCGAYFQDHPEVLDLGPTAAFVRLARLAQREVALGAAQLRHTMAVGRLECRVGDDPALVGGPLLVKCLDSCRQPAGADCASFDRELTFFRTLLPALQRHHQVACAPTLCASRTSVCGAASRRAALFEWPDASLALGRCAASDEAHLLTLMRHLGQLHLAYWLASAAEPHLWSTLAHLPYAQPQHVLPMLRRCFERLEAPANEAPAKEAAEASTKEAAEAPTKETAKAKQAAKAKEGRERLRQLLDEFEERLRAPFEAPANGCWTLCHQRCGLDNVVFEYDDEGPVRARLFNWQSMGVCSLGVDLVIALLVEQRGHQRSRKMPWLVDEYRLALHENPAVQPPTTEAIYEEIKRCAPVALYVMAERVHRAQSDSSSFPRALWNEAAVVKLMVYLIKSDFV